MKALHAGRVFDGTTLWPDRTVLFDGARIVGVVAPDAVPAGAERVDLPQDHVLAPGFIDLQVNGGGGVLFNDTPDAATLRRIASAHAQAGTTAILPRCAPRWRAGWKASPGCILKARSSPRAAAASTRPWRSPP
jgi:N-acetylglucosamine-6-phosphate deacetylase